ncbi:MAG: hypothetical protein VX409_05025 [Verrucomicrobiota bacterium]|nr:hypothetical protein [Verrucomicrobiota bacterium]
MIDFQKIRNKQKWLFGIIAIPVIIGFVIMFTPDATDTLLGRNNQRGQQMNFGELNGEPVTRDQWLSARQLSGMIYGRYGNEYMERKIVDTLVEMEMLEKYSIRPTTSDALDRLVEQIEMEALRSGIAADQVREVYQSMSKQDESRMLLFHKHLIGTQQLRQLAGMADGLVSEKEAEIQYREENEEYEAEAVILSHTNYLALVQMDDNALKNYYTNSLSKYRISESRQLSYVTFQPTNFLTQAEAKYLKLSDLDKRSLLTSCWPSVTGITNQIGATVSDLAKYVVTVQTNEFEGMKIEDATGQIREKLFTTPVGLKAGLAVVEAYSAGVDFQQSLQTTYAAKPALDTLEKVALLQNIEVKTTPPLGRDIPFVPGLQNRVEPSDVFALSETNALIVGASALSSAANADPFFIASLKKIMPARDRSFAEAKSLVSEDYKKAESIKLLKEAGDKMQQSINNEKSLADIAKENNFKVIKIGPFASSGGSIEGLDQPGLSEDVRTQVLGLELGATSELITSSTDNDVTDHEVAFVVKLNEKLPVSKEAYEKDFPAYLKQTRARSAAAGYNSWLQEKRNELYKFSFNAYSEGEGEVEVDGKLPDLASKYFESLKVVPLIARSKPGYRFKEWSGRVREGKMNATNSVLVIENSSVTATFVPSAQ